MSLRVTTAFGTVQTFRNPVVYETAFGTCCEGLAQQEGRLYEEYLLTRLDRAESVEWLGTRSEAPYGSLTGTGLPW